MSKNNYRFETFKSVYEFEDTLNKRPINSHFSTSSGSSDKSDVEWYQTRDYNEADLFLDKGWNAKIDEVKGVLEHFSSTVAVKHRKQVFDYVGFMPSVPRAIMGYPQAMINYTKRDEFEKQRTKHIIFNNCANCGTSGDNLLKSGLTVLKLAMILDKSNVRTKIDMLPFFAKCSGSYLGCSVTIKDYRQSFNYLKMAYPIANPSFFRRHGFRYLETQNGDEWAKWTGGYGSSIKNDDTDKEVEGFREYAGLRKDDVVYITYQDCERANFDVEKLMANIGLGKKKQGA